ncbi:uncharacterized protein EDB91DRAFT_1233427 [Suillus paluster]|uniref:uncharacterized protein n=1 Tax=Suillus paluster TaxID=48578 RepID=UPI001B8606EF|nr:uncharacterized protein EDB91DRAFT_1233427 [Suillus paluster]KAG1756658.1 hypothetical protein EDB91DRAFT_1233427 [Suillus paluster]
MHENACRNGPIHHPDDTSEPDHLPPSRMASPVSQFEVDDIQDYRCGPGAPAVPPKVNPEPWRPFRTRIDFEVAELAHEAVLTHEQTDWFIKLIHCSRYTWDAALFKLTPFTKEEVVTFLFFHHSLWDWAVDLLQDPEVGPHFVFDAQQLSKFDGEKFVWHIHEPWTADAFWEYQSKIPSDAKPLVFILYADKAKLSSFSCAKGYPVVARCTNLPVAVCNGEGLGGGQVVGWLPIVKEDKKHSRKPAFVNFKNAVWHTSFLKLLACLAPLSRLGSSVKCWDDVVCTFYPIILILSADYEEQVMMALIRGLMGKFPCPVCLVPREELSKGLNAYQFRMSEDAKALHAQAQESTTLEAREQVLSSESLRDVDSAFDTMEHTNVYQTLSFDKLNFNDEGKFDHLWTELQKWITNSSRQAAVVIDALQVFFFFESFLCWRNLNHFNQVVSISFSDGMKYEDISKLIVFAAHNVFKRDLDSQAYLLLCCIQSYVEFNTYASLEVHTKDTIRDGRNTLLELTELMDIYIKDTADLSEKSWNFPKMHLSAHLFDDIEAKGVTQNYNMKPNEKMHGPLKDTYQDCTNFKNFAEQILQYNHDGLVAEYICSKMECLDAQNLGSLVVPDPSEITEFRFIKVSYESLVDWRISVDYLQCNPMFHGSPQYDCVILQAESGPIFAKLLLVFTCTVGDVAYPIALTLPYDQLVGTQLWKDKDFKFWRVKAKPRASAECFSVQSIICGCVLAEDSTRANKFLVVDMTDTDIFL